MARRPSDPNQPIYVISIAAELAGVHPQTLRVYERKGLVSPKRTQGNSRRYSEHDIDLLRRIQDLTNEGVNLAGVIRILELEKELARTRHRLQRARHDVETVRERANAAIDARDAFSLVPLKDVRRIRRAMKSDQVDAMGRPRRIVAPPIPTETDRQDEGEAPWT
ncbi:MAG: heat shock protein transcriptional repressor HspR [Actinomycetota bacterium]